MIRFPKPRGFWDYALFALVMTAVLILLFWGESSNGIGWADIAIAFASVVLSVFAIILARSREKAKWIRQPSRHVYLLLALGAFSLIFGALYADAYLLHPRDITSRRLLNDLGLAIFLVAWTLWSSRRRATKTP